MKAILVIDMPECCYDCDFCRFNGGYAHGYYGRDCLITGEYVQNNNFDIIKSRHETCPLKPMPKRKLKIKELPQYTKEYEAYCKGEVDGWNFCIDELFGVEE